MYIVKRDHAIVGEYLGKGGVSRSAGKLSVLMLLLTLLLFPFSTFAAIDVTAAIANFSDIQTAAAAVGAAFLAALAIMAVWKLARGLFA